MLHPFLVPASEMSSGLRDQNPRPSLEAILQNHLTNEDDKGTYRVWVVVTGDGVAAYAVEVLQANQHMPLTDARYCGDPGFSRTLLGSEFESGFVSESESVSEFAFGLRSLALV